MHTYEWAKERLRDGTRVRRSSWPVSVESDGSLRKWHLFVDSDFLMPQNINSWENGIVNGWGGQVGCASDDDLVRDGMLYLPTKEDREATDWELFT